MSKKLIMPVGKYRGKLVHTLPDEYLTQFYKGFNNNQDLEIQKVLDYVLDKLGSIKFENKVVKKPDFTLDKSTKIINQMCPKEVFTTESDARYRLKFIREMNKDKPDKKIPIRVYECERCGFWHLTSQENRKFVKKHGSSEESELGYEGNHKNEWLELLNKE